MFKTKKVKENTDSYLPKIISTGATRFFLLLPTQEPLYWMSAEIERITWVLRNDKKRATILLKETLSSTNYLESFINGSSIEVRYGSCSDPSNYNEGGGRTIILAKNCELLRRWITPVVSYQYDVPLSMYGQIEAEEVILDTL